MRVPEHAGSVGLDWNHGSWRAGLTVRGESDQLDVGGVRDGFVTARVTGGYALDDTTELTIRVENLADTDYQEVLDYGEPGRAAHLGSRVRF